MIKTRLPNIILLGTGGTIASTAPDSSSLTGYTVTEGVASIMAAVPGIEKLANLQCMQLFNVESFAITNAMLLKMSSKVNKLLANPAVDGVVITHGTDTLEESAYFLNLTVKSPKPVVVVGAMRPGSALSADGPLNLYNAVLLAGNPQACGQGVLIVLNDCIQAARFVSKTHTTRPDTFHSYDQGFLGHIHDKQIHLFQTSTRAHTTQTEFDTSNIKSLPAVDIIYDHQSAALHLYQASIAAGTKGIVIAGCGNGSLSPLAQKGVRLATKNKVVCVRASRTGSGVVSPRHSDHARHIISSNSLNPQKARILLMLALGVTTDTARIQSFFEQY